MFFHVALKNSDKDISFLDKGKFSECWLLTEGLVRAESSQSKAGRTGSVLVPVFLTWECNV